MMSMSSLVLLLGLVILVTGKLEVPKIKLIKHQTQVLNEQNPRNGPLCFSIYRPKLDSISTQYEVDYRNCQAAFINSNALEDESWTIPRSKLEAQGTNACRAIIDCSSIVGYVEAFECYAQMGSDESKSMYTISADAVQISVEVSEFYRIIETTKTICINNAERSYVDNTTTTYELLNSCLNGNIPSTPPTTLYTTTPDYDRTPVYSTPYYYETTE